MSTDATSKTTMKTTHKLAVALAIGGAVATLVALLAGNTAALNVAVGYASAAAVTLASARSYARAVQSAVEAGAVTYDLDRDAIDKQEDPYDLYAEASQEEPPQDLKAAIAEEKARLKAQKRSFAETVRDSKPAFSLWRLGAYGALALGFMVLHGRGALLLPYYLVALGLPSLISVGVLAAQARKHDTQKGEV